MERAEARGQQSRGTRRGNARSTPMRRPLRDLLHTWLGRVREAWPRVSGESSVPSANTGDIVGGAVVSETPEGLLRRLQWTVLRPLASRLGGDERSLVRGFGLELSELREYQPGDDVRHIDWNTTARTDRPYVREAYARRTLSGRSMSGSSLT
jgi:hypothetical protein